MNLISRMRKEQGRYYLFVLFLIGIVFLAGCSNSGTIQPTEALKTTLEITSHIESNPIYFNGTESQASPFFTLERGLSIFYTGHIGDRNFIVYLLDTEGNRVALVANEIEHADSSKAVGIELTGRYLLDITADGYWWIIIDQPRTSSDKSKFECEGSYELGKCKGEGRSDEYCISNITDTKSLDKDYCFGKFFKGLIEGAFKCRGWYEVGECTASLGVNASYCKTIERSALTSYTFADNKKVCENEFLRGWCKVKEC